MKDKREALKHIEKYASTLQAVNAAREGLKTGNYDKALHIAANNPGTAFAERAAKEALGFKWNGRDYE